MIRARGAMTIRHGLATLLACPTLAVPAAAPDAVSRHAPAPVIDARKAAPTVTITAR